MSWFTDLRDGVKAYYGIPAGAQQTPTTNPPAQTMSPANGGETSSIGGMSKNTMLAIGGGLLLLVVIVFALRK